ncbi:MAG: DEAD/DEAH box helicase, partial [Synergistota bacterium]|nr:DEAD/DEAH box helicase [Synergistota bacterium]
MSKEIEFLKRENKRLKAILSSHGIDFTDATPPERTKDKPRVKCRDIPGQTQIDIFRNLFKGRPDVFAIRWESAKGKSGYSPACRNEWKPGICDKRNTRCAECRHRDLIPINDQVIKEHLSGRRTIGLYPLLEDETCFFLAADFDGKEWQEDSLAFIKACRELEIPASREISRSGKGAHVWIFFSEAVPAREARRLGSALVSYTCSSNRQLAFKSYDRFFPNQDTMPKGGFGNLIALPLQGKLIEHNCTVFADDSLHPFPDQWSYLDSLSTLSVEDMESAILRAGCGGSGLDIGVSPEEETPWKRPEKKTTLLPGPLPECLDIVFANQLFFAKKDLAQPLSNQLIRLAAFQNPEFYKAQAMRFSVWNKPRIIGCAENYPEHISIPRGCLEPALEVLQQNKIQPRLHDEREKGRTIDVKFSGKLRKDQQKAVKAIVGHDVGVLCAPTAFGKTVIAAALIAERSVSTLVLVHRAELLRQWL